MTQQDVHERVYANFIRKFSSLEKVAHASERRLAAALREGGLATRKASQLKAIAKQARHETGRYDLNALAGLEDDALEECLRRLPGVGPKVARCVMMYSYARYVFPVDTHCWRTAQRLGWLGRRPTPMTNKGIDALQVSIPPTLRFSLHVNLVSLGRDVCKAGRPLCDACVLADICPSSRVRPKAHKQGKTMSETKLDYDPKSRESILALALRLEGKTLGDLAPGVHDRANYGHKGEFGDLVERLIFGLTNNNEARPDLEEAGVEIKTAPLRNRPKAGVVPKERLVLGMINYKLIVDEEFTNSKFWSKNACLLILFYLWELELNPYNYEFIRSLLHEFSDEDLRIIKRDWESIRQKVRAGQAHELSEGDTFYLGACTKSSDSTKRVTQPNGNEPAKPRAFSLKPSYLRVLLEKSAGLEPLKIGKQISDIEKFVLDTLGRYKGWSEQRLLDELYQGQKTHAKNRNRILINRMLDMPGDARIEQFTKADLQVKTIPVAESGAIEEPMSFRNIDFSELVGNDIWEESAFYEDLTSRFLLCVFKRGLGGEGHGFHSAFFWTMPQRDLEEAKIVWSKTRTLAIANRYDQLPGTKENAVAHVRTKGKTNKDFFTAANGALTTKRCFWLNRSYIKSILEGHPDIS